MEVVPMGRAQNVYRSLLLLLFGATQKELARYVRNLHVENRILRNKLPQRVAGAPGSRSNA